MSNNIRKRISDYCENALNPAIEFYNKMKNTQTNKILSRYDEATSQMELFSRIVYGIIPYCYGGGKRKQLYLEWFNSVLCNSIITNRTWWNFSDCDQKLCEMVPISLMFVMNKKDTWDVYSTSEKKIFVEWMNKCNEFRVVDNNWNYFPLIVNSVLKFLGESYNEAKIRNSWKKIDSFYLEDGWYKDGDNGLVDYYAAFAFQFYPLVMLKAGLIDDERKRIVISRAQEFAKTYLLLEDKEGRYVPYGRSLCYRTAQSAFWSGIAINGIETVADGYVKDLIYDNICFWFKNHKIMDESGLLNIGYEYGNQIMSDEYNSYGSPYWAMKGFMVLCLGDDNVFWNERKVERETFAGLFSTPVGLIFRNSFRTDVTLYPANKNNALITNGLSKYNKFVYSSKFGYSVPRSYNSSSNCGMDCILTAQISDVLFLPVDRINSICISDDYIDRTCEVVPGLKIRSIIVPGSPLHIRIHIIDNYIGDLLLYDGGFSIPEIGMKVKNENEIISSNGEYRSKVSALLGSATYRIIANTPNSNICFSQSRLPVAVYRIRAERSIIATSVYGGTATDIEPNVSLSFNGEVLRIQVENKKWAISLQEKGYIIEKNSEPLFDKAKKIIKKIIKRGVK